MRHAVSAVFWAYMALSLVVWWFAVLVPWLISVPFDRRRRFAHWYAYTWANHFHAISPFWTIIVRDTDRIRADRSYVVVSNHESSADILLIFALKKQYRWVSKRSNFRVPLLGWMMWMAGYVPIERGNRESLAAMMRECQRQLEMGNSIMMFPEGTRATTDEMRPFKIGAFKLACEADVPVAPIVIAGTQSILPRRSWVFGFDRSIRPRLQVLEPVDPAEADHDPRRLMELVRTRMDEMRGQLREELLEDARTRGPGRASSMA